MREAPTLGEIRQIAEQLPPDQASDLLRRLRPMPPLPTDDIGDDRPAPVYESWTDYLANTTAAERQQWCRAKAKIANRTRLMSGPPDAKISGDHVWAVLSTAEGRCEHCGSLAVERRPSGPGGRPRAWASIGRRIGSLGHRLARFNGGSNQPSNLCWSCLWCNTWPEERRTGATDHGGHHPSN
jgi:hypothetical protein